jgi:hypothetical protein
MKVCGLSTHAVVYSVHGGTKVLKKFKICVHGASQLVQKELDLAQNFEAYNLVQVFTSNLVEGGMG